MKKLPTLLAIAGLSLGAGAAVAASSVATVGTTTTRLGTILVGSNGHTLYVFSADKKNKSNCSGSCATYWPALVTGRSPKATGSAKASELGTIKRGGTEQVTYDGHPLYEYVLDTGSGDTAGQAVKADGGTWYVIGTNGSPITKTGKTKGAGY
ncbi:MAG: hypothetical protein ABSC56_06130 [Solirubrobacteraceae bacterium]|jgi:predicted lipoprotein with Yx(FWY)xxD motif